MKTKIILFAGLLTVMGACEKSEYEIENLVPDQYHKILYINNSGVKEMTLYNTGFDTSFGMTIFKGGSDPSLSANATISVLSQEAVNKEYAEKEGIKYKVLGNECFSFDNTVLDFTSTDRYKNVTVSIKVPEVEKTIKANPDATCVLPIYMYSETDSVNSRKNEVFIKIKEILTPSIGFVSSDLTFIPFTVGFDTDTAEMEFGLDTENKWDIDCEFEVDPAYLTAYNKEHGTSFTLLPEGSYSFEKKIKLPKEKTTINIPVTIKGKSLQPVNYMLPIKVVKSSMFGISENAVYPMVIQIIGKKFDRENWTYTANSEERGGEGPVNGYIKAAFDNDVSTFWHSKWAGGSVPMPYEIIIDTQKEKTFTQIGLSQRQHPTYMDTKDIEIYTSSDKKTWTPNTSFTLQKVWENQIFNIVPTKARYIKLKITTSYRSDACSLSEIYLFGLE